MPIRSRINQYRGVNAHLHSIFHEHSWYSFHLPYMVKLMETLGDKFTRESGYWAGTNEGMQGGAYSLDSHGVTRIERRLKPELYQYPVGQPARAVAPLKTMLAEYDFGGMSGVAIYKREESEKFPGQLITQIELLSPGCKLGASYQLEYLTNRKEKLRAGIRLVEIDLLHEQRSHIAVLPSYPDDEPASFPYSVLISDPLPTWDEGKTTILGFRVDDPIPTIDIPLIGEETITVNLGEIYNQVFESFRLFWQYLVDYEQLPERFETYREDDQQRIHARMTAVQAAHARGIDLETGPFPLAEGA